jgi:hypothetical protein
MAPRRCEVCMLSGTLTPLWSTLAGLVREHSAALTRVERQLKVVRVQSTDSNERIVGVRWSPMLQKPLRERLELLRASKAGYGAVASRQGIASLSAGEPIEAKALERALKPKPTIKSFFSIAPPKAAAEPRRAGGEEAEDARGHGTEVVDLTSAGPTVRAQGGKRQAACASAGGGFGKKGKGKEGAHKGISHFFQKGS